MKTTFLGLTIAALLLSSCGQKSTGSSEQNIATVPAALVSESTGTTDETEGTESVNGKEPLPIENITQEQFDKVIKSNKIVLVDFSAVWCGPCKMLKPIIDKYIEEKKGKIVLFPIDTDKNKYISQTFKIEAIPTLILFKNGKQVWNGEGFMDDATFRAQMAQFE